jgi:DNA-binding transcriptional MerR regulator
MENSERDEIIARHLGEGTSLSEIQKILQEEHDVNLTYMELRLISSGLEVNWSKLDPPEEEKVDVEDVVQEPEATGNGETVVNVSKVVRPGAVVSGDVTFKSGARAEWYLDQLGRLGLNPTHNSGKPSEEELQEFQQELQGVLHNKM